MKNLLRGEWNKSSDKSGVLGGEEDLSVDGDRWSHGEGVDGGLSGQGGGDWDTTGLATNSIFFCLIFVENH